MVMTRETKELLDRALKLPVPDRVKLAQELLDSVPVDDTGDGADARELSPEWKTEIATRLRDEPEPGKPWATGEEVIARLRRELETKRPRKRRRGS